MNMTRHEVDLTTGSIWKKIALFALPLLFGNIFQQLYNTVDTIVLGQYVGKTQLAGVGTVGSAVNALIGFFMGISSGATVIISQYRGARNDEKLSDAVQTSIVIALIACVVCTVLGYVSVPLLLRMMKTPADAYPYAESYLRIYFLGVSGVLIYNVGAGILRAVGDSRRPLYFLLITAFLNTALDLLFVLRYHWDVEGVAYATVISQAVSAALVLVVLTRSHTAYRVKWRALKLDARIMREIFRIGLPAALQSSITSISNVFVQGYINRFGSDCMAAWAAYGKVDQFALLPLNSLSISATTFVGQNLGAGDIRRAKKGIHTTLAMSFAICAVMCAPMIVFRRALIGIFNGDAGVLEYGALFLQMMSPFYILCGVNQIYAGALRGAGVARAPMLIMLSSFVAFRQIYLFVLSRLTDSPVVVALAYPMGWILCSALMLAYFYKSHWEQKYTVLARRK